MPYWPLSSFYFFYFASLGILVPYWGLYLDSLGFSPFQIGQQAALLLATKVVAPTLWGWIADHTGQTMRMVRFGALLALIVFLAVFLTEDYWWLTLTMVGFGIFWNVILPQVEATTLNHLGDERHRYGRIRLWGSIGFIFLVIGLGPWVDSQGPAVILPVITIVLVGIVISTWWIPPVEVEHDEADHKPIRLLFLKREVVALLGVCFLMQVSHAPFYTFFSIYLTDYGYSKTIIGGLWAIGVVCEVGVFLITHWLFRKLNLGAMLMLAFVTTALRWLLVAAFPEILWLLVLTQATHAITYGVYHAAAIQYVHRLFRGRNQHRGQSLYSSVSFGLGGGVGSFSSGLIWTQYGPQATFIAAALVAAVACLVVYNGLRPTR